MEILTLNIDLVREGDIYIGNYYMFSENSYNKLRYLLSRANINFEWANATILREKFSDKYDLILLSNILTYFIDIYNDDWSYDKIIEYEDYLMPLLKEKGIIFLQYVFSYIDIKLDSKYNNIPRRLFFGLDIHENDLLNGEELITFNSPDDFFVTDAMVLKRKID